VRRIFEAKGRPTNNPLIVHVADARQAGRIAVWNDLAGRLAVRFWPGPLYARATAPHGDRRAVTGGGPTVAVRQPAHTLARGALLAAPACRWPPPAPTAPAGCPPTTADHVLADLDGLIDAVLDGGPTTAGIESTVLDRSSATLRLLRRGRSCRRI